MRGEETAGHLESLLATALLAPRWTAAYVAVAMGGSVVVLAANGLGAGLADAINSDDAGQLPRLLAAGARAGSPPCGSSSGRRSRCSGSRRARSWPRGACSARACC